MFRPHPISLLQFGVFWVVVAIGAMALFRAFKRNREPGDEATKSRLSSLGIMLQGCGFVSAGVGPVHVILPWSTGSSLAYAGLVAVLGGSAIAIFIAATKAMGRNWSVVARMRCDHELVRTGPFAVVRHPIYLALFLHMLSFAIAFGHFGQLLIAIPFFCAGTVVRIREEEKLLRAQFGEDHARYVREVPAFLPFIR